MKIKYDMVLCEDCRKEKLYFIKGVKGKRPFWCESCAKKRFEDPILKVKLTKSEYLVLKEIMKKAKFKGSFREKYNPIKKQLDVILVE